MMNIILFDDEARAGLLPLTFTRPLSELRLGILTIREKWQKHIEGSYSWMTEKYLSEKFPKQTGPENLFINGSISPDKILKDAILALKPGERLMKAEIIIAFNMGENPAKECSSWKKLH